MRRIAGELHIWLTDRLAGQTSLRVIGDCTSAEKLVGRFIWAGGSDVDEEENVSGGGP